MAMRTYGNLQLIENGTKWEISQLEPHVSIRLKQIFPRLPKQSAGPFHMPRDLMVAADLEWFTARYPLRISDEDRAALTAGKTLFDVQQADLEQILLPEYMPPPVIGLRAGEELRHYQHQAIQLVRRRRNLLLGDEGGLGKTYTAAGFLCAEPGALPAAIVVDAHMQRQWRDKLKAFTTLRVHLIKKGTAYDLPPADVYIFKVTSLAGWVEIFAKDFFKAMIIDEPQSLRTGTQTTKGAAAKVLYQHTNYHLGLTATPIMNYGVEMWRVMQFIDDMVLGSYEDFVREYVDGNGHIEDPKALGTFLREQHVMLRRLKSDVGQQLPKVSRIVETVDYDAKVVESIESLARQLAIKATTGNFLARGQAARELDIMVRQATGVAKAKAVAQFVRILVEAGEPVLLLGWHRAVYDVWLEELKDFQPAMYTGTESPARKHAELQRFKDGETPLLIMSLRSGAGVDEIQHRCSIAVFGELDWSPGIHQQVIWRLDREGQQNPVMAFFLVSEEGSDPPMMDVLGIKASEARQIVDPHLGVQAVEADKSNMHRLVERYLARVGRQVADRGGDNNGHRDVNSDISVASSAPASTDLTPESTEEAAQSSLF
ncbi:MULTISPECIES: DEAD/DEAH box helicase [unclassified Burkholderia]|uniref:DEAD/DEAH box helicase n=1 Tax=unclassified Burkholderia TaxID=2613784 RepID=UPI002AB1C031|nr:MULTISPECIES: DEAD/DEAH box helicase [unclassified Burkholderia]